MSVSAGASVLEPSAVRTGTGTGTAPLTAFFSEKVLIALRTLAGQASQ
jgi:hypothetical protein